MYQYSTGAQIDVVIARVITKWLADDGVVLSNCKVLPRCLDFNSMQGVLRMLKHLGVAAQDASVRNGTVKCEAGTAFHR
jgi:hypothetical protein